MNALYGVLFAVAVLGAGFIVLLRMLASRSDMTGSAAEWMANFSLESYAPMERLLDERDFVFLSREPGYDARIATRLRAERKAVFKAYLARLVRDFNRLLAIAKLMLVHSGEDRTEFAKSLWRQQATFYFAVCVLRFRLALYPVVIGSWDIRGLVGSLEALQSLLRLHAEILVPRPASL